MSDFLTEVLAGAKAVIRKEVAFPNGTKGEVCFRRVTAGERLQLLKGMKMSRQGGQSSFELDLALNEEQQHKLVLFSVCKDDGSAFFKDLAAVNAADGATVHALYKVAASIDKQFDREVDEPGKD